MSRTAVGAMRLFIVPAVFCLILVPPSAIYFRYKNVKRVFNLPDSVVNRIEICLLPEFAIGGHVAGGGMITQQLAKTKPFTLTDEKSWFIGIEL